MHRCNRLSESGRHRVEVILVTPHTVMHRLRQKHSIGILLVTASR